MTGEVLYSDNLIEISSDSILFKTYYYPFRSKRVFLADIERITYHKPTFWGGKWRIYGTGDFRTWSPYDRGRTKRAKILLLHRANSWRRVGFTAEDSWAAIRAFEKLGILDKNHSTWPTAGILGQVKIRSTKDIVIAHGHKVLQPWLCLQRTCCVAAPRLKVDRRTII